MQTRPPSQAIQQWLDALGYNAEMHQNALHRKNSAVTNRANHAYSREIKALLSDDLTTADVAVFEVDKVPTVCFIDAHGQPNRDNNWLNEIRKKIWNQSLISIVLVFDGQTGTAYPIQKNISSQATHLELANLSSNQSFFANNVISGEVQNRHPDWFKFETRVDRDLLHNLKESVKALVKLGLTSDTAQFLLGQCLFVSYLEHRAIVSDVYRKKHAVLHLNELIKGFDKTGLVRLFSQLKKDFNGDFLDAANIPGNAQWHNTSNDVFELLDSFLSHVDIGSGQTTFDGWTYDFRYIPVELISGIYETFLGDDKKALGAYYTPRHLANVAVDHAFQHSSDICSEIVYDGACGSGILLTTAFRRMICVNESQTGVELGFADRCQLLQKAIKGSDLNRDACRLTAFSLYLSLLEDLKPNDITLLQEDADIKLPTLIGKTIWCGVTEGDFFSDAAPANKVNICTIFLSNPPWKARPKKEDSKKDASFLIWAEQNKQATPLKQIAASFAQKALTAVKEGGRVCLILPASLIAAPISQPFLRAWLRDAQIHRIINFSDSRRLLFANAVNPCMIAVAEPRAADARGKISYQEQIDYWVPKSDVSLAFGRLTVHGTDKHRLPAQAVWQDNQILRTYSWGNAHDEALIGKLKFLGTIEDLTKGKHSRWKICKGFHSTDASRPSLHPAHLNDMHYLDARCVPKDTPLLPLEQLATFPEKITTVTDYGSQHGRAFKGPRVLFTDGVSTDFGLRAVYSNVPFSFQTTIGAICGDENDGDVIRFLTMYLRSNLARYFLLHTSYSLTCERSAIKLNVLNDLPFVLPENHHTPKRALEIVNAIATLTKRWETKDIFEIAKQGASWGNEAEKLIFEYFALTENDALLIKDACETMIPSVQPSGYAKIRTPYSTAATPSDLATYANTLMRELQRMRVQLGGSGGLAIDSFTHTVGSAYVGTRLGIIRVVLSDVDTEPKLHQNEEVIKNLLTQLNASGLLSMQALGDLRLSSDFLVRAGDVVYLIKPLVKRLWLASQALKDGLRIIEAVR